jgi:DNA-binding MarR family transcriptional regulator
MDTKDRRASRAYASTSTATARDTRVLQSAHDLVVELLKVFATLDRAMTAHRQFHMAEAVRLTCELLPNTTMRGRPSPAQIQLSIELSERGPGTISELASRLRVSASAISLLVDRMVAHGMVERIRSMDDRRVVQVRLSPAAAEMASAVLRVQRTLAEQFLEGTPPEDRLAFLQHIDRLAQMLDTPLDAVSTAPRDPHVPHRIDASSNHTPPTVNPTLGVRP